MSTNKNKARVLTLTLTGALLAGNILALNPLKVLALPSQPNPLLSAKTAYNAAAFSKYDANLMILALSLNRNIGELSQQNLQFKLDSKDIAFSLSSWQFISQYGASNIEAFCKKSADNQAFVDYLMGDTATLNMLLTGGNPTGNNPIKALEILQKIWSVDKEAKQGLPLKLAIATSLAHAEPVICWNTYAPIDPVVRYTHFKQLYKSNKLLSCFNDYDVMHMRMVVNSWSSESDIDWLQEYVRATKPEAINQAKIYNSAWLVPYRGKNKDGVSIQAGNDKFYGKGWNLKSIVDNGGVCGNTAKFGAQACQAFGVAAMPTGQPRHCAFAFNNDNTSWQLGNNIAGWGLSNQHAATVIPFANGNLPNQEPYLLLLEDYKTNKDASLKSEQLRWLSKVLKTKEQSTQVLNVASKIQPLNIEVWRDRVELFNSSTSNTDEQLIALNNEIMTALANHPRPMTDLLNSIKANTTNPTRASRQSYIINMTNTLDNIKDVKQKEVATQLTAGMDKNGLFLATFSFDGADAGKLKGIQTDTEYSLDGGKTYTVAKTDQLLTSKELSMVNSTNNILLRVAHASEDSKHVTIKINKECAPVSIRYNSTENILLGIDNSMEFSTDNQETWTRYSKSDTTNKSNLPEFKGKNSVSVRRLASEKTPASKVSTLSFTASTEITKGFILHSNMSIMNVTSQQDNVGTAGKNAIDGDTKSCWHSKFDLSDKIPSITIQLDKEYNLSRLDYLPRQDGGVNGTITSYNIYTSSDNVTFTKVSSGDWADNNKLKSLELNQSKVKFIKLESTKGHGGFASASEINLYEK